MFRITELVINGRTYERRKGRSINRWTYVRANDKKRVWVHSTSRLQHALEALAGAEERNYELHSALQDAVALLDSDSPEANAHEATHV